MMNLNIRVITPDKIVWDALVEEVFLPSVTGQIGILKNHIPLLTGLDIGVMRLKLSTGETTIFLGGGFAEIENNRITILCTEAQEKSSIDAEATKKELTNVTAVLKEAITNKEFIQATIDLKKAKAKLQAIST